MKLEQIKPIAEHYVELLRPFCERIEIAGSIRREKAYPGDIEIVCIPKRFDIGKGKQIAIQEFVDLVRTWEKVKGEPFGKYTQRLLPEGVKLDLFMVREENWGLQFAIRTGSADYSHQVLAKGWVKAGYKSNEGMLTHVTTGIETLVFEEEDLFKLIAVKWIEPKDRNL